MGSVGAADVTAEKRRLLLSYGQPTRISDYADMFVSNSNAFTFSCHVEAATRITSLGRYPPRGIDDLLFSVRASLTSRKGTSFSLKLISLKTSADVLIAAVESMESLYDPQLEFGVDQSKFSRLIKNAAVDASGSPITAGALLILILLLGWHAKSHRQ
jgi:hypothetical protein